MRQLTQKLKHKIKKDIIYMCVVLTNMKVVCSLYKLAHANKYLQCNKFFVKVHSSLGVVQIFTCHE
jgi:hypothetical protein